MEYGIFGRNKLIDQLSPKIEDYSISGKCSKCGECCSRLLPVTKSEMKAIIEYTIKNNIEIQAYMLTAQDNWKCPFFNGNKCLIYEVRPLICKEYYCYNYYKSHENIAPKFIDKKYYSIDMWKLVETIEKIRGELK